MKTDLVIAFLLQAHLSYFSSAFTVTRNSVNIISSVGSPSRWTATKKLTLFSSSEGGNNEDEDDQVSSFNEEGLSLAADFSKILQQRNIQLNEEDLMDDDDDEEEEYDEDILDEEQILNEEDMPTISDEQVFRELDERVLETAGGFVDLLSKDANDEDTDDEEENTKPKPYEPPTTIPDPELTAGEVVMTVLDALNHNDVPMADYGIVVLFGYSSPGSAIAQAIDIEGMTPAEYGVFLKEEYEYKILFNHVEAIIEKGDYSADKKKAFFTARLQGSPEEGSGFTNVNFILSASEAEEDGESGCWMIDSLLIRPEGMRRRRRK